MSRLPKETDHEDASHRCGRHGRCAALPAAAQTFHDYRPVARYDHVRRDQAVARYEARREAERRLEWRLRHERSEHPFRDSGYGYRR